MKTVVLKGSIAISRVLNPRTLTLSALFLMVAGNAHAGVWGGHFGIHFGGLFDFLTSPFDFVANFFGFGGHAGSGIYQPPIPVDSTGIYQPPIPVESTGIYQPPIPSPGA